MRIIRNDLAKPISFTSSLHIIWVCQQICLQNRVRHVSAIAGSNPETKKMTAAGVAARYGSNTPQSTESLKCPD